MDLLAWALQEAVGPALVLDANLRIVGYTPGAIEVLEMQPELGVSAPKLLCGHGQERPVAEALAAGRAVTAQILRPAPDGGNRAVHVRASPFSTSEGSGWLVMLEADAWAEADGDAIDERGIVTRNAGMKQLLREMRKVAVSNAGVLVRGETGSGKELVARAIHHYSARAEGPFRAINCAALPPNLLESELFGHVRGAFTGAVRDAAGHFKLADGGTIFLDEVAELPLDVQAKLLRVLQDKTVIPVGGQESVSVDVRIVAATHRALRREAEAGRFRHDLLYRLRVIPLFLPALRERLDDIELLTRRFLDEHERAGARAIRRVTPGALDALMAHDWPGNVRELQNVIEYATVMGAGPVLVLSDLPPELRGDDPRAPRVTTPDPQLAAIQADLPAEARRFLNALERSGGHMGRAAAALGISRTTLWRRLKKHGLDRDAREGRPES